MTIALTREEAQQVLDALDEYRDSTEDFRVANRCISLIETLRARLSAPERNCTRSHPHENMDVMCELRTEIARLTNENARLKSQPEPEPVTDKYLMEVECTKCGAKQDGVLTVTVPPQREEGCAECGKKSSDGWALYCVKCSEREWQGMTDEEAAELCHAPIAVIEAKLKEKNT
jgi:hypothetical protein